VREVFHLGDTLSRSKKKNTVAAINAIEMIQKEIPTKSSCLSTELEAACAEFEAAVITAPTKGVAIPANRVLFQNPSGGFITLFMMSFLWLSKSAR
jgi:hypothetical protein